MLISTYEIPKLTQQVFQTMRDHLQKEDKTEFQWIKFSFVIYTYVCKFLFFEPEGCVTLNLLVIKQILIKLSVFWTMYLLSLV